MNAIPRNKTIRAFALALSSATLLHALPTQAETLFWEGRDSSDWHNTNNWDIYAVPTAASTVLLNKGSTVVSSLAEGNTVEVAYYGTNTLTLNSTLAVTQFISVGRISGTGILNVNTGGGLVVGTDFRIGDFPGGIGTVNMSGGSVTVTNNILLGIDPGGVGTLNLSGGTITTQGLYFNDFGGDGALIISGGTLTTDWLSFNSANGGGLVQFTPATSGKMVITDAESTPEVWLAVVNGWINDGYIVDGQAVIVGNAVEISAPPTISIGRLGSDLQVTWSGGTLNTSTNLTDWVPEPGAVSPLVFPPVEPKKFFRAVQ